MKIVDRNTFLSLPANTLFSKYEHVVFGDLCIKGETIRTEDGIPVDFYVRYLADSVYCSSSEELSDVCISAADTGASLPMNLYVESRYSLDRYDDLFAVWEDGDLEQLIERLRECRECLIGP